MRGGGVSRFVALLIAVRTAWRALRGRPTGVSRAALASRSASDGAGPAYDPSERIVPSNRRIETVVAVLLLGSAVCGFGFLAVYIVLQTNTQLLGVAMGGTLILLAAALIIAGKLVVPQEVSVEPREPLLDDDAVDEVVELVEAGGEGVSRRGLLVGAGGLAGAALVGAAAAPVASLGPPAGSLHSSPWAAGIRLVDDTGKPYAASDIEIGTFYTALPEGGNADSLGAGLIVVRLPPAMIQLPAGRHDWAPDGIMAYSKICPHAGCAINLYRYPLDSSTARQGPPAFTCPCHYSTFLPGRGGELVFGPAGRELPQLPLKIDSDGNLRCAGPFDQDVGPSWWGVRRT